MTDTTAPLTPPVAGDTKRAFLVRNGLAKEGARGRFGKDAIAALAQFPDFTFVEVVPAAKPKAPKAEKPAESKPVREARARVAKVEKVEDTRDRAEAITPNLMPKRVQKVGYAVEPNPHGADRLIAYTTCAVKGGCGKAVNFCTCTTGPVAPHYLDKSVAGKPLLLTKPVV